jgi:uncharacterized protein (UPF0264 family)
MTRLLVSVRDLAEAEIALAAGVDLLDLKEPRVGALGAVADAIVKDVVTMVAGRVPVSVACGELLDRDCETAALNGVSFAKVGLAGCALREDWPTGWQEFARSLPHGTSPVAVAYVDATHAASPVLTSVLEKTAPLGARALLLDTWGKSHGGLLDHVSYDELQRVIQSAHAHGMIVVLGGSLVPATIARVLPLAPDVVAVRGAACAGRRDDSLDRDKVDGLVRLLRQQSFRNPQHAKTKLVTG